jgi:suppressor of G2 allele of SKP1
VSITFPLASGSDFVFSLDGLAKEIKPEESTFQVLSTKISLQLAKKVPVKWSVLEQKPEPVDPVAAIKYPTSSRKGTKNWDQLEKEAIKESEELEKGDGDKAANELFRSIYNSAGDDMKRAMIKSYVESNGTHLSTNWDEVGKAKVETSPPESMVAKKWGE